MISIIICSQKTTLDEQLKANIRSTIGKVEYELVVIDNSQGKYNIFEAYNWGVSQSKGDCLCFMHEDVLFHSQNWGIAIETHLSQSFVGAIGLAGGNVILPELDWRFYGFAQMHLIQGNLTVEEHPKYYHTYIPNDSQIALSQVAAIDGVWMCMRKQLFEKIRFDDTTFHGFHLYDTDICMQINALGLGVFVTYDVLLEHKSEGVFSENYRESLAAFKKKWETSLPFMKGAIVSNDKIMNAMEKARPYFENRLSHDALVISIRNISALKASGKPCRAYTADEKELIDESMFRYRKDCIKDRSISHSNAWILVKEYLHLPFASRKYSLFFKFIWYRYLLFK